MFYTTPSISYYQCNKQCFILHHLYTSLPRTVIPNEPIDVGVTYHTHIEARIEWTVPSIVFSAETYTLMYSITQDDLNTIMGETMSSGTDLSLTDQVYSVLLKDLSPGTKYYYQIKIENTFGIRLTQIYNFDTRMLINPTVYNYSQVDLPL